MTTLQKQNIADLYRRGMTLKSIGNRYHKSHVAIRDYLLSLGVTMRPRGRRPVAV